MSKDSIRKQSTVVYKWQTPELSSGANGQDSGVPDAEQQRLSAMEDARRQGYAAGLEQAKRETDEQRTLLASYVQAMTQPFADQNTEVAEYIAGLAGKIARSLVQKELSTDPESLMSLVKAAVAALNTSAQKVNIHLNPHNAELIRELIAVDSKKESWNIVDDPLIGLKDCRVSRENSLVDTDLESRIDLIISQFIDDERDETLQ